MCSVKKIGPWLLRRSHPLEGTNISTLNAHLNAEIISFPHFPISPFPSLSHSLPPFSFPSPFALLLSLSPFSFPFSFLFSLSPFSFLLSPSPFPFPFHFLLSPFSFPSPFAVPFLLSLPSSPLLIFSSSPLLLLLFFSFLLSPFPFPFPFPSPFPFLLSPFSFLFSPFLLSILLSLSLYKWNAGVTYRWRNPKLWFSLKKWTPDLNTVFKLT